MTKKLSKRLKIFFAAATIFSTVGLTVSCSAAQADLTIGVRSEEINFWEPIVADFEKATGKKVDLIAVQDMNNNYELWKGTGIIPNVTVADASVASRGIKQKDWFQALDLNDIISSKYIVDEAAQNKDMALNDDFFTMSQINAALNTKTNMYNMIPMIYGPNLLYMWNKDNSGKSTLDGSINLDYWVPNIDTNNVENLSADAQPGSAAYRIVRKKDGSRYKNTPEDIQEFIYNSARKSQTENIDLNNHIYSIGNSGFLQRMHSVITSLFLAQENGKAKYDFQTGAFSDLDITFGVISEGTYLQTKNKDDVYIDLEQNNLDDNKWLTHDPNNTQEKDTYYQGDKQLTKDTLTKLQKKIWYTKQGYYNNQVLSGAIDFKEDLAQTPFGKKRGLATLGAKWQYPSIAAVAKNDGKNIDDLSVFAVPIQTAFVDGYAISKDTEGEQLTLAKQFIRFMVEPKQAARMASNKAVSIVKAALPLQPIQNRIDEATITSVELAFKKSDDNTDDLIDFIPKIFFISSNDGKFDVVNGLINADTPTYLRKNGFTTFTIQNWAKRINEVNAKIKSQQNQG